MAASLMREVGTSAPCESDPPPAISTVPAALTIEGVLRRDAAFAALYPDLLLLKNCPDKVFARAPFVSSAVVYKFHVAPTESFIHCDAVGPTGRARKMIVVRSSWLPRKHSQDLFREIYAEEGLTWTVDSAAACAEGGAERLMLAHPESVGLRMLALHKEIRKLCQARDRDTDPPFPLQRVLDLGLDQVRRAAETMARDPFRLLFRAAHGLDLPDMHPHAIPLSVDQDRALQFYQALKKETYEECHSVTNARDHRVPEEPLAWLVRNGVIARSEFDPNLVSLAEIDRLEIALIEAIRRIEDSSPAIAAELSTEPQLGSGLPLCSEQAAALRVLTRRPVLAVDGRAGSGKTDFLHVVSQLYGDRVYCTAFQGVNAGQLARVSKRASTTHRLLYDHARNHGPFKCALKGVEVLVVDEVGTQSLTLLAGLLSAFATCGAPNKKIVLVGDLGQLPPIGGPAPFRHLIDYFGARGYLVNFSHNHRAVDSAGAGATIAYNASAIRDGDPDAVVWDEETFVACPPTPDETPEAALMRAIGRFDLAEKRFIVVTHMRKHVALLCEAIERRFGGSGLPGAHVGRKFAFTKNDYEAGAVNNEILVLERIEDREIKRPPAGRSVTFKRARPARAQSTVDRRPPDTQRYLIVSDASGATREVLYEGNIVGKVKKASAVTSNAMQGSARETVVRVDFGPSRYSTRERLYTDVTRAEKRFVYVGKREWFDDAVRRPEPIPRSKLGDRVSKALLGK